MQRTLRTIRRALRATSATLVLAGAGCAESDRAADGGAADIPEMDARVGDDLAAFPLDELWCTGTNASADDDAGWFPGGYFGECCPQAMCYTPESDAGCESAEVARQGRFFFGSGTCNCGDVGDFKGPYARPDDAGAPAGECCYVVPVVGCTGRPLSTDRGHLLAPVVASAEWIA